MFGIYRRLAAEAALGRISAGVAEVARCIGDGAASFTGICHNYFLSILIYFLID
jgi:hypothetical protein